MALPDGISHVAPLGHAVAALAAVQDETVQVSPKGQLLSVVHWVVLRGGGMQLARLPKRVLLTCCILWS